MYEIKHGDCIDVLRNLENDSFGAIITDPPYCSGGAYRGDRVQPTSVKYLNNDSKTEYHNHDFAGDAMDQRVFMTFTTNWLKEARRVVKQEGVCAAFIDWRQLPAMTDCFQMAGWIWRGIAVWNKPSARPQNGRFRAQAEYIVWGSNGTMPLGRNSPVLPGVFTSSSVPSKARIHQTQKPIDLMRQVVKLCEKGERILDPFAGSGTTILAAELEGFDSLGVELDDYYATEADKRIKDYMSNIQQTAQLI